MTNTKKKNKKHCIYDKCYLPENNNIYLIQLVYAVITALILGANKQEFTLTSILLYITPFLIDLTQNKVKGKIYDFFKGLLMTNNILLLIFIVAGIFLIDVKESYFSIIETAILFAGLNINKEIIFFMCLANITVPILLYIATPCQKTMKTLQETENIVKSKNNVKVENEEVLI